MGCSRHEHSTSLMADSSIDRSYGERSGVDARGPRQPPSDAREVPRTPRRILRAVSLGAIACLGLTACNRDYRRAVDAWYLAANTPSQAEPTSDAEREVLAQLPALPPSTTTLTLADTTVSIGEPYASAARRLCRPFVVQREPAYGSPTRRVACSEGSDWFLVPDLLEDGSSDGPEDVP